MEYYLALKRKEILTLATTWTNLRDMLRERANHKKTGLCDSTDMRSLEQSSSQAQTAGWWVWGPGEADGDFVFNERRVSLWDNEDLLGIDDGDGYTTV